MSTAPLPAPDADAILVARGGAQTGPMSRRTLAKKVAAGEFSADDHYFHQGMTSWATIGSNPALLRGLDPAVPAAPPAGESADDRLDRVFGQLVKESWSYFNAHSYASHIDEVFLGAVITCTLDNGYALIDLSSDGTHHYVRFQNIQDGSRILCRLTHLTGNLTQAKVHGHRASVIIGYGERLDDFTRIFNALRAEVKSGFIESSEPGTITVDGDMNTGYIYVQVDLFLSIDTYIGEKYEVRYEPLREHLAATLHALRKYLRGRFAK